MRDIALTQECGGDKARAAGGALPVTPRQSCCRGIERAARSILSSPQNGWKGP